jgi:hypothetical protein
MIRNTLPPVVVGVVVAVVHCCNFYVICVSRKNCDKKKDFFRSFSYVLIIIFSLKNKNGRSRY